MRSHSGGDQSLFMPEADPSTGCWDTALPWIEGESRQKGSGNEGQIGSNWCNRVWKGGRGCVEAMYQVLDQGTWIWPRGKQNTVCGRLYKGPYMAFDRNGVMRAFEWIDGTRTWRGGLKQSFNLFPKCINTAAGVLKRSPKYLVNIALQRYLLPSSIILHSLRSRSDYNHPKSGWEKTESTVSKVQTCCSFTFGLGAFGGDGWFSKSAAQWGDLGAWWWRWWWLWQW